MAISTAFGFDDGDRLKLERSLLKDNAADLLREHIVSGRITPGTKLVERVLSEALGISRMPVRDALMKLEDEGLVISRPLGRFVIELSERDVLELYTVRSVLEKLAVELAAERVTPEARRDLLDLVGKMSAAQRRKNRGAFVRADMEIHRKLWSLADNRYLLRTLEGMLGPLLIFISSTADVLDWSETLDIHTRIVSSVIDGDIEAARTSIDDHMASTVDHLVRPSYEAKP